MKYYIHTVNGPHGIQARPAGMIARLAKEYADTSIVFACNGREAKATSRMKLMHLGVRQGTDLTITADGANEDAAIIALSQFVNNNL